MRTSKIWRRRSHGGGRDGLGDPFTGQLGSWVRDRERQTNRRQAPQRHGRKNQTRTVFFFFQRDAASHREDSQGQAGRLESARTEAIFHEMNAWVKQCRQTPNFHQAGAGTQVADHPSRQKDTPHTDGRSRKPTLRTHFTHRRKRPPGTQDGFQQRRVKIQDLVDTMWSASPAGESSAREHSKGAQQGFFTRERQGKRKGNAPIVSVTD